MSYFSDLMDEIAKHKIVLVTGPQRSGTQICSRILAQELDYAYLDEGRFQVWDVGEAARKAIKHAPCVVQGPGLLRKVGKFIDLVYKLDKNERCSLYNPTAVLVRRSAEEIIISLSKWPSTAERLMIEWPECLRSPFPLETIPALMYFYWDLTIYSKIGKTYEIPYELLSEHEFWVPKEERVGWRAKQWRQ